MIFHQQSVHACQVNNYNWNYFFRYGLLGASGCGKTTVLSTIVGLKSLDQGIVSVFGGIPGDRKLGIPGKRVGYMPQVRKTSFCDDLLCAHSV